MNSDSVHVDVRDRASSARKMRPRSVAIPDWDVDSDTNLSVKYSSTRVRRQAGSRTASSRHSREFSGVNTEAASRLEMDRWADAGLGGGMEIERTDRGMNMDG